MSDLYPYAQRASRWVGVISIACLGLGACGEAQDPDAAATKPKPDAAALRAQKAASVRQARADEDAERLANAVVTGKSSAAIDLRYAIATKPLAAQPVELELVLEPRAAADALEVEVSAVDGLTIVNPGQARFAPIASGEQYTTRLLVSAQGEGMFYVNVIARLVNKVQTEVRTFSVPLVVGAAGEAMQAAAEATAVAPVAAPSAAVKSLPAEEKVQTP